MTNWSSLSATYNPQRKAKEQFAAALLERSRRSGGGESLDLLSWTMFRRAQLTPGRLFNLVTHPYLTGLMQCQAQTVVVYKSSQMGASEYAISYALHAADQRQATVLYLFPTDTHVSDFSSARFGPAIEASPYLDSIIVSGAGALGVDGQKHRGSDRVTLKRVRDRFLYLRGAQVTAAGMAPQLKSIDADVVIYDEVDEMDPRAPTIAKKRLGHSAIAEERFISTPTYPGFGIHAEWLLSDQREWFIRCEACGHRQMLTIDHLVTEWDDLGRPRAWHTDDNGTHLACEKCMERLNRLAPGEWVATAPGRDVAGFHLTKLFSSMTDLDGIIKALDTTDETKRREAYNQDLGLPYQPKGGQLTLDLLDACRRDYAHKPVAHEPTVMGVDVGKVLHVVIRGPQQAESGERPQRWAGEVESFEALGPLMQRFGVVNVVIDAMPETKKARDFQASQPQGRVWLAYYVNQRTGTKRSEPAQWDADNGVVNLDRTRTLDTTFGRFLGERPENTLPGYARDVRDYYAHLTAPVRVLQDGTNGEKVTSYVESGPDHLAHAENYCTVASFQRPMKPVAGVWGRRK